MRRIPRKSTGWAAAAAVALLAGCGGMGYGGGASSRGYSAAAEAPKGGTPMSFFVTSSNPGKGGDLGGLAGADRHCQALASAAGAGGRTWRAYLSTTGAGGVNARDRIGKGPWRNARGEIVANDVEHLHGPDNKINKQTALTEKGEPVKGRGDTPNQHDILTGSNTDGRALPGSGDTTCGNWTSSTEGAAMVGHHDRMGLDESPPAKSWNASHLSRGGCSIPALNSTGGAGYFYCFATN